MYMDITKIFATVLLYYRYKGKVIWVNHMVATNTA